MFRSLRKTLATVAAALALAVVPAVAIPVAAHAADIDIGKCLSQGSDFTTGNGADCQGGDTAEGSTRIQNIVKTVVNIFSVVVGIVAVIMIIVGGFKYITSGGDSGNITGAKNTIVYALIGLVIVALSQFLVQFVLEKVSSS
jgi:hypothetical protein